MNSQGALGAALEAFIREHEYCGELDARALRIIASGRVDRRDFGPSRPAEPTVGCGMLGRPAFLSWA